MTGGAPFPVMIGPDNAGAGQFCWVDLAATNSASAKAFYGGLFGWTCFDQPANGGFFTRLRLAERDVGSLYQLRKGQVADGVPSHWTPYVRVDSVSAIAERVPALGGRVLVAPFEVAGIARVALILDSVGAQVGLWEPLGTNFARESDGQEG